MIPLYGSASGMSYDPHTKLYHGDGEPRLTPYRADGTWRLTIKQVCEGQAAKTSRDTRKIPTDIFHVQTALEVRDRVLDFGCKHGVMRWKLCRCTGTWGPEEALKDHLCHEPAIEGRISATPVTREKLGAKTRTHERSSSAPASSRTESNEDQEVVKAGKYRTVATGAEDGAQSGVQIRNYGDFFVDGQCAKQSAGVIARDLAYPGARAVVLHC